MCDFKTLRQTPVRCPPDATFQNIASDARQTPARRNISKSGVRRKILKSCTRRYILWPCVRCAVRVWLCRIAWMLPVSTSSLDIWWIDFRLQSGYVRQIDSLNNDLDCVIFLDCVTQRLLLGMDYTSNKARGAMTCGFKVAPGALVMHGESIPAWQTMHTICGSHPRVKDGLHTELQC